MTQPLLIVKQRPMAPYDYIMVPLDFSPASELAMFVTTAYFTEATVSVVHAYEVPFERALIGSGIPDSVLAEYRQQTQAEALRRLMQLVDARLSSPMRVAVYAQHGHPAQVIRTMVEDLEPDLIIMGKNAHSMVERWLIGSITKRVLHEISCDVLIVTPA